MQTVLLHLLHADSLRLGFVAFFVAQGLDFVGLSKPLDDFRLQFTSARLLHPMLRRWAHSSDSRALQPITTCHQTRARTVTRPHGTLTVHHQPLIVLLSILLLQLLRRRPIHIIMRHGSQVCPAVCLNDDEVPGFDGQPSAFLYVEDVGAGALEEDDVEELVVPRLGDVVDCAIGGGLGEAVGRGHGVGVVGWGGHAILICVSGLDGRSAKV